MPEPYVAVRAGCPSCGEAAEPEEEDGVLKLVCPCGFEFGHKRIEQDEDSCSLGIPEALRLEGRSISIDFPASDLTEEGRTFLGLPAIPRRPE